VLLIIGFPIVMATAFVQEGGPTRHPAPVRQDDAGASGLTPEPTTGADALLTWRNALAGGVLAFAMLGLVGTGWMLLGGGPPSMPGGGDDLNPHSIAVLPFTTVGPENEAFRVGVHDALLTQLAKVRDLRVTSRTSVMDYEGTRKSIPQIGEELGVARILEGGVQRADDVVLINVQLIDAATDNHLWAESYTRDLSTSNLIAIQTEIVRAIARELRAVLAPEEEARIASVPTDNLEAYDLFLQARDLDGRGGRQNRVEARQLLEQAVILDPAFALAWAYLSIAHSDAYWFGDDRTTATVERARAAVDRSSELDPKLPEVALAMGNYHYRTQRDYDAALRELTEALDGMGETAELIATIGSVERRMGAFASAAAKFRRAGELDPRSASWSWNEGQTLQQLGEFNEADRAFDRTLGRSPNHGAAWNSKIQNYLFATGDLQGAQELLDRALEAGVSPSIGHRLAILERDPEKVRQAIAGFPEVIQSQYGQFPSAIYAGEAEALARDEGGARALFDSARVVLERYVRTQPGNEIARFLLPVAYAKSGHEQEAREAINRALETPVEDAFLRGGFLGTLAQAAASNGDRQQAIELIRTLTEEGEHLLLSLHPNWDPLRGDPAFEALVDREREFWRTYPWRGDTGRTSR